MYRLLLLCLCIWVSTPSCVDIAKAQKPRTNAIPVLKIVNDSSGKTLQIHKLQINVQVTGNIATTTFDITFYNDLNRQLEGEFDFPLADGQSISRYALEVGDKLREGVVVEKVKARVAFENTERRKIDPGLVEKTQGNNFRTRIYPIPAKGYKRIVIGIEQALQNSDDGLVYELPLSTDYALDQFAIDAAVARPSSMPVADTGAWGGLKFNSRDNDWQASFQHGRFRPSDVFKFTIPLENAQPLVYTETHGGKEYFYAYLPAADSTQSKPLPKTVMLFWDISASAASRDVEKERAVLDQYFSALSDVTVTIVPFNIHPYPSIAFHIGGGDTKEVMDYLKRLQAFDGGTQLGALDLRLYPADEIVLVSDGISTFGKKEIILPRIPVTTITSAPGADFSYLRHVALETRGRFVDLGAGDTKSGVAQLLKDYRHFISADYNQNDIESFATSAPMGMRNGFGVSGIVKGSTATVTLHFAYGNTPSSEQVLVIEKGKSPAASIARIWANMTINELDLQYEKNKEAITSLGKQFSIVTQNTSLIVLDRVEDYVANEIEPPADLLKEYQVLMKKKNALKVDERRLAMEEAEEAMHDLSTWWLHPPVKEEDPRVDTTRVVQNAPAYYSWTDNEWMTDSTHVVTTTAAAETFSFSTNAATQEMQLADDRAAPPPPGESEVGKPAPPTIDLQAWKADAPYLVELEKTAPADRFKKYLALKSKYAAQPSYFIDVARFFYAKKDSSLSLQILSNVAEMKLENPELLRDVAEQLLEFGEKELALETFKEVLNIREEEPQAYRDLALAYSETGNYSEAVRLLYKVATGIWTERFGDVRQIALNEMNAIISAHRERVNLAGIDKKFIKALPVDVRIVIGWSADNSDVDLWVTDPRQEKCFYVNTNTALGGRISKDATQGYGPEEYLLKKAVDGAYEIEVNLYGDHRETLGGPITIKAELFTNFGRPNQERKIISVRVTENKEVIKIGKLAFGA